MAADPTSADAGASLQRLDGTWQLLPAAPTASDLLALLGEVRRQGGGHVRWVVSNPSDHSESVAHAAGLSAARDLPQLRRPLPLRPEELGGAEEAPTRGFVPGSADEEAWIATNNRAFAEHPDQGRFTAERLHERMGEDWFDPDGLRLHERQGSLAGFCWTRRHPATAEDPELGEIYAIGIDPAFQGLGLGRGLVLAGLNWLAGQGVTTGMLYTDSTNEPALRLYRKLGYREHHTDRLYEATIVP